MKPLNLNIENWSLFDTPESTEFVQQVTDVVALADDISFTNNESLCELLDHNYTH